MFKYLVDFLMSKLSRSILNLFSKRSKTQHCAVIYKFELFIDKQIR